MPFKTFLLSFFFLSFALVSHAQELEIIPAPPLPEEKKDSKSEIVERPDVYAQYPCVDVTVTRDGKVLSSKKVCGKVAFEQYLQRKMQYPESAREKNEKGTVFVQFTVSKKGKISDVKILRGVSPALNAEAIRLIDDMPKWVPALQDGKKVASYMRVPIRFELK